MFRPNYAQDAPPDHIEVGGASYAVNVDFRVWIDVIDMTRELFTRVETVEDARHNAEVLQRIQMEVFGGVLEDERPEDVLHAVMEFARGYPSMIGGGADSAGGEENDNEILSFDYDINYLVLAIKNQSGIDLSYRRTEPFHWWEFLLQVRALCGDHYILRVMETRASDSKDKDVRRAKRRLRLPHKPTAEEQRQIDELHAAFGD